MGRRSPRVPVQTPFFDIYRSRDVPGWFRRIIYGGPTRPWIDWLSRQVQFQVNKLLEEAADLWQRSIADTVTVVGEWAQIGGDGINGSSFSAFEIHTMDTDGTHLYVSAEDELHRYSFSAGTWELIGGSSQWGGTPSQVRCLRIKGGFAWVGLLGGTDDSEVWKYEIATGTWTQIADSTVWGSAVNSVGTIDVDLARGYVYVGLGSNSGDGEVHRSSDLDGTSWTKIGGDGQDGSPTAFSINGVTILDDVLYASFRVTSGTPGASEFWRRPNPHTTGTWVEEDPGTSYGVHSNLQPPAIRNGRLYWSTFSSGETDTATVWEYDPDADTQTKIGGNGVNGSWADGTWAGVRGLWYDEVEDELWVGLAGNNAGEAEIWKYRFSRGLWEKQGDTTDFDNSPNTSYAAATAIVVWDGVVYSGFGISSGGDVWGAGIDHLGYLHPQEDTDAVAVGTGLTPVARESINSALYYAWNITSGAYEIAQSSQELLDSMSGASVSTTNLVPAGAYDVVIVGEVETEITGATDFDAGDGTDVDLFGAGLGLTVGTEFGPSDYTAAIARYDYAPSGLDVTLTANISNFTAGAVRITAFYKTATAG